jgi:hypothetical protein
MNSLCFTLRHGISVARPRADRAHSSSQLRGLWCQVCAAGYRRKPRHASGHSWRMARNVLAWASTGMSDVLRRSELVFATHHEGLHEASAQAALALPNSER